MRWIAQPADDVVGSIRRAQPRGAYSQPLPGLRSLVEGSPGAALVDRDQHFLACRLASLSLRTQARKGITPSAVRCSALEAAVSGTLSSRAGPSCTMAIGRERLLLASKRATRRSRS